MENKNCKVCQKEYKPYFKEQQTCGRTCANMAISNAKRSPLRACKGCGTEFQPKKTKSSYCSHDCYAKRHGTVTKTCETCSKEFTVAYRFRAQKTCGLECAKIAISKTLTTAESRDCAQCGKQFTRNQYDLKHEAAIYCSQDCFLKHRWGRESATLSFECEHCHQSFERPFTRRHHDRFCSKECVMKATGWNRESISKDDPRYIEITEKMSNIAADMIVNGKWPGPKGYNSGWHASPKAGQQFHRSSYEKRYFEMLDSDPDVLTYKSEPFKIPYVFDGCVKNYTPDVLVERVSKKQLIEVKPASLVDSPLNAAKADCARAWCLAESVEFLIVTQDELMTQR